MFSIDLWIKIGTNVQTYKSAFPHHKYIHLLGSYNVSVKY